MFEKNIYQLYKFVNKNIKGNKPCNKFVVTQCELRV